MKKIFLLLTVTLGLYIHSNAADAPVQTTDDYFVNDQQVENVFNGSLDVSLTDPMQSVILNEATQSAANQKQAAFYADGGGKSFVAALLLDLFLGGLGIHRIYLGTKTLTWVGYILTIGGIFGIVPLVDLIVLIVHNSDISPYVDNPKFFMWGGN